VLLVCCCCRCQLEAREREAARQAAEASRATSEREREKELELIRQQYLGGEKQKKRSMKVGVGGWVAWGGGGIRNQHMQDVRRQHGAWNRPALHGRLPLPASLPPPPPGVHQD
jgi:hypothetical protein